MCSDYLIHNKKLAMKTDAKYIGVMLVVTCRGESIQAT